MIGPAREAATEPEVRVDLELITFPNDGSYDELVVVRDIPFEGSAATGGPPYRGVAHVAYVPADRVVGAFEVARLVEHVARDAPSQEQLTMRVAAELAAAMSARGAGVVVEGEHWTRHPAAGGARTVTTAATGCLRDDRSARAEFLASTRDPSRVARSAALSRS